uniref:non-specific serine/threonine protein kinase n=1 Tax=Aegilops tauschii TaxID=37682 RepID=M8BM97_AEGTA
MDPPGVVSSENAEYDFSDVFGSSPVETATELCVVDPDSPAAPIESPEEVYNDPAVIFKRSHSLVGPSSLVSCSLGLGKLTLNIADGSSELVGHTTEEKELNLEQFSDEEFGDAVTEDEGVGLDDFEILKLVGQGAFGKVFQVRKKGTSEIYAMKVMRKDKILEKNHSEYMKAERDILTKVDHPYVVQLREELARIYTAEIISAVAHLHANGIMHRDLKPENILLDAEGHAMLTDFGLAKEFRENTRSNSMCGTLEYMAPEIIQGQGHDKAADWWSVGILLFEMLTGKPPFVGNRDKVQQKIVKEKLKLPPFLTSEAHSLLKGLLHKEAGKRLGTGPGGSDEIKRHKWFKPINWRKLDAREIQPSFRPDVAGLTCIANFDVCWTNTPVLDSPAATPVTAGGGQGNFAGFTYVRPAPFLHDLKPPSSSS